MKKLLLGLTAMVVLTLDWTALDDITTSNEPSFLLEWLVLGVSIPVLAGIVCWFTGKRRRVGEADG